MIRLPPEAVPTSRCKQRGDSWKLAKKSWYDLRSRHLNTSSKNHVFEWRTLPPFAGTFKAPLTPPTRFIREYGFNPFLFRIANKRLSLIQQQYIMLLRMYFILQFFGISFAKLPLEKNLKGTLRTCARKITQIGFSVGSISNQAKA